MPPQFPDDPPPEELAFATDDRVEETAGDVGADEPDVDGDSNEAAIVAIEPKVTTKDSSLLVLGIAIAAAMILGGGVLLARDYYGL